MYICCNSCKCGVRNVSSNFQKSGLGILAHRGILQGSRNKETKDSRDTKFWKQRKVTSGEPPTLSKNFRKKWTRWTWKKNIRKFRGSPNAWARLSSTPVLRYKIMAMKSINGCGSNWSLILFCSTTRKRKQTFISLLKRQSHWWFTPDYCSLVQNVPHLRGKIASQANSHVNWNRCIGPCLFWHHRKTS